MPLGSWKAVGTAGFPLACLGQLGRTGPPTECFGGRWARAWYRGSRARGPCVPDLCPRPEPPLVNARTDQRVRPLLPGGADPHMEAAHAAPAVSSPQGQAGSDLRASNRLGPRARGSSPEPFDGVLSYFPSIPPQLKGVVLVLLCLLISSACWGVAHEGDGNVRSGLSGPSPGVPGTRA